MFVRSPLFLIIASLLLVSCAGSNTLTETDVVYKKSSTTVAEVLASLPNYSESLTSAKGKGRAIVSETGKSDRFSIDFESDREVSLLSIKNRLGIEGGAMLVAQDSILMYFKVDKIAQKVSVNDGRLTSINELASINFLDLLSVSLTQEMVKEVYEAADSYLLRLTTNGGATVSKNESVITSIKQPYNAGLPYSHIIYESYGELEGYILPRKITIFSNDGASKVLFQLRSLEVNPSKLDLTIDIPSNIPIERL